MEDREARLAALCQDRNRVRRHAKNTKRYVSMLIVREQKVPEEFQDLLASYKKRLDEINRQIAALRTVPPITSEKIVGHIGPETLLQLPDNRAAFARQLAHDMRHHRRRSKWER